MEEVSQKEGRTVLFVSHNMGAIRTLCQKTLILERGKIKTLSNTEDAINTYLLISTNDSVEFKAAKSKIIQVVYACFIDRHNRPTNVYDFGDLY